MDARLICDGGGEGGWNMASDEALLASTAERQLGTLRFYGWEPATLSLGYFQAWEARTKHDPSVRLPMVRRHTGGGAIVHDDELTYCLAFPIANRFAAADALVQQIHQTLIDALRDWSVSASLWPAGKETTTGEAFLCFQRRATHDLIVDGHKIAGSAQRRQRRAALLHGSVLFRQSRYAPELPGLEQVSRTAIPRDDLRSRWTQTIAESLKWHFHSSELDEEERAIAGQLLRKRYGTTAWNRRR